MLKKYRVSSFIAARVKDAIDETLSGYRRGDITEEDHITSTLIANIRNEIDGQKRGRVSFRCIQARGRGKRSLESRLGADFVGFMEVDYPTIGIRKLFSVQVKKALGGRSSVSIKIDEDLTDQCDRMLALTEEAIVMVISESGIDVVDARAVYEIGRRLGAHSSMILDVSSSLYPKRFARYMQEVYTSWQGDQKRGKEVSTVQDLERIIDEMEAKQGFAIQAHALT